jgi:hypothetical protein
MTKVDSQLAQYVLQATENYMEFFPVNAVRVARDVRNELIPELIKRVEFAINCGKALSENYMGHIFALYLLAEFRVVESYETMLQMFFLDEDALYKVLGDTLTEGFGSIIASVAQGRYKELLAIFEGRELYEFARLAALSAVEIQLHKGLLNRQEVEEELGLILSRAMEAEDVIAVTALVDTVCEHKIKFLADTARKAFDQQLVDTFVISRNNFEEIVESENDGDSHFEKLVNTAEESMSWWHCFKSDSNHKVPRNALCPCRSGLKFKRCCYR